MRGIAEHEDRRLSGQKFQWWWFTIVGDRQKREVVSFEILIDEHDKCRFIAIRYAGDGKSEYIFDDSLHVAPQQPHTRIVLKGSGTRHVLLTPEVLAFDLENARGAFHMHSKLSWSVGALDSWLPRRMRALQFMWTVPGAQVEYTGSCDVQWPSGARTFRTKKCFGYRDRNFGANVTPSWRWIGAPSLVAVPYEPEYDSLPLGEVLATVSKQASQKKCEPGTALIVGGRVPVLALGTKLRKQHVVVFWRRSKRFEFQHFDMLHPGFEADARWYRCGSSIVQCNKLRRGNVTLKYAFMVDPAQCVSYPITQDLSTKVSVYNGDSGNVLLQSGLARGLIVLAHKQKKYAYFAPVAGFEIGEQEHPQEKWMQQA
jgi:hypothetical protein